jgi:hypothetical protein
LLEDGVGLIMELATEISAGEMACVYGVKREAFMF